MADLNPAWNPATLPAIVALLRACCDGFEATGPRLRLPMGTLPTLAGAGIGAEAATALSCDAGVHPLELVASSPSPSPSPLPPRLAAAKRAAAGYGVATLLALVRGPAPVGRDAAAAIAVCPEAMATLAALGCAGGGAGVDATGAAYDIGCDALQVLAAVAEAAAEGGGELDLSGEAYGAAVAAALARLPPADAIPPPGEAACVAASIATAGAVGGLLAATLRAAVTHDTPVPRLCVALATLASLARRGCNTPTLATAALADDATLGTLASLLSAPGAVPAFAAAALAAFVAGDIPGVRAWLRADAMVAPRVVAALMALLPPHTAPADGVAQPALAALLALVPLCAPGVLTRHKAALQAAALACAPPANADVVRLLCAMPASETRMQ